MSALSGVALTNIAGFPLVVWLGLATITMLLSTATYGYGLFTGKIKGQFSTHLKLAVTTILIALIHATLAISLFI
ncbi:MAG TPA: hypothetical protein VK436_08705 [Methanocella sp.]|nr:hypothetical protein [Methanocella sp.]